MGVLLRERCDRVVIGAGPAGTGTAYFLGEPSGQTTILEAGYDDASFQDNQQWGQAGLLYLERNPELALKLHEGLPFLLQRAGEYVLARDGHFFAASEQRLEALEAAARAYGFPLQRLAPHALATTSLLGPPRCVGGFRTRDAVIDYPGFLDHLRSQLVNTRVVIPAKVTRLLSDGHKITGVIYKHKGMEVVLHCDVCVLTAGAWSIELLQASLGVTLPVVKRWKSPMFIFGGELVDKITVCLDNGLTLVPFKGTTRVANTQRVVVENLSEAHEVSADMVETIRAQLCEAFPQLKWEALRLLDAYT